MTTGSASVEPKGREKVRVCLITPLQEDGLIRGRNQTVDQHQAMLTKLQDRLGYMSSDGLVRLRRVVRDHAEGKSHNLWPLYASIWNWARRIERPPVDDRHIAHTWLASVEGPEARAGGYLVELYEWLKANGVPPAKGMPRIRTQAQDNRRRRDLTEERIGRRTASDEDRVWLEWYLRQLRHCEEIVRQGEEKRAAAAEAEA